MMPERRGSLGFPATLSRFFRRRPAPPLSIKAAEALNAQTSAQIERLERLLVRVQRDVEQIKLHTGTVLGSDRAIALLATGDHIYIDPRDGGCGMNLLNEGKYEEDEIRLFRRLLKPGITVLDIGANYGYYSIIAAPYVRPGGRVIGFEPNPHVYGLFSSSLYTNALFDVVEPRRLGAYDSNGELRFEINESSPGGAHVVSPTDRPPTNHLVIDVPVVRLDDHLPEDLIVHLVKIDVEGYEEHVLNGMRNLIGRSPEICIFMEFFYPFFVIDADYVRLMHLIMEELGLRVYRVLAGGRLQEVSPDALRGEICTLVLTRQELKAAPDLTIYPTQLRCGDDTGIVDNMLIWQQSGFEHPPHRVIAHGPYVFLPKGRYRMVLDADFDGRFQCRIQENFGDLLWEGLIESCRGYTAEIHLVLDAPRFEIVIWSATGETAQLRFRRAEFWPI